MTDVQPTKRVIEAHTIYSAHLREERTLKVFLPPDHDPEQAYPVIYCHDGLEFFTHGRIATLANKLIAEGSLRPLLIVGIAVNKSARRDDYDPDGARHAAYCTFVRDECLPFVESRYRVDVRPGMRWMAGISLGATATLSLHLRYPEMFSRLLLFSGAYYSRVQELVKQVPKFDDLVAYMLVGEQETAVETPTGALDFYRFNQAMRDLLRLRGARIHYEEAPGTHIWGFWQSRIPDALRYAESVMRSENRA